MTISGTRAPMHLWVVGLLALVWNGFGAFDYFMTQTRNPVYLSQFSPEQLAYFDSIPGWVGGTWAVGVWGAVIGSILLLARSRHAATLFALALAGLAITTVWQFFFSGADIGAIWPMEARIVTALIWIIAIALLLYARRMRRADVLR